MTFHASKRRLLRHASLLALGLPGAAALGGCAVSVPAGIQPVTDFDAARYMGTWYEIARIDQRFEAGLSRTSAHYTLQPDGSVRVLNRGYHAEDDTWKESEGRAKFLGDPSVAALKVSFFRPFYGGYNVVALDPEYQNALVIGSDIHSFWLLSRNRRLPDPEVQAWLERARILGVNLADVMRVAQS